MINIFGLDYSFNTFIANLLCFRSWKTNRTGSIFHEDHDDIRQKNFMSIQLHFENTKADRIPDISGSQGTELNKV